MSDAMLDGYAAAIARLDEAYEALRFADAALAMADGALWSGELVDAYMSAREAYLTAYDTLQAYTVLGPLH